ncbi:medium chain dehydrogenase/reductase family protein [Amycolatopsis ultiminotia]|uniref:Medium chain dehydrogenase/reductase family protein n=1 Tax=Amycolatopsis ultiminotia TaxID=543629 RepID=A0ABP6V373_9PSEU
MPAETSEVVVAKRGGPRALRLTSRPLPTAGDGEVRIDVRASGVAFGDLLLREGLVKAAPKPFVPGYDVAGVVGAVGAGVEGLAVGDRVVAATGGWGGYAAHVVLPAWKAVRYSVDVTPEAATSLALNYLTAYQMLRRTTNLAPGSTVLIHSAAGGVGSALVQLGALRGLRMFGTASAGKAAQVEAMGATAIDYRSDDFVARVRREASGGVDAVFDGLGPHSWKRSYPLLRANGILVPYGITSAFPGGRRSLPRLAGAFLRAPRTGYFDYFAKGVGVVGYSSGPMISEHPDWYREDLTALLDLLGAGRIEPLIHRVYPLGRVAEAHEELGRGRAAGKIVLTR